MNSHSDIKIKLAQKESLVKNHLYYFSIRKALDKFFNISSLSEFACRKFEFFGRQFLEVKKIEQNLIEN